MHDIIAASQKYAQKIGEPYIPVLNKPTTYTFMKNKGKDFITTVEKQGAPKVGPNHYKIFDAGGFASEQNLKKVKFAFNREKKESVLDQYAKKKSWVPSVH